MGVPARERFEQVYRRCRARVVGYVHLMTRDLETAAEIAQETFLRAHEERSLWEDPSSRPEAWLFRVAGNLARNHLRARGRRLPLPEPGATPDTLDLVLRRDDRSRVVAGLDRLAPSYAQVLLMRYYAGLSCAAIADELGVAPGTVMARLHRARRLLRRYVQ